MINLIQTGALTMDQTDAFLAETMPRMRGAAWALHTGDVEPWMATWSQRDPVTLFGAVLGGSGWGEIVPIFRRLGASFDDCTSFDDEIIAAGASDDLAYTVAYEHTTAAMHGGAPTAYTLRVTTIFRREGGEWKVVHRHGDSSPSRSAAGILQQLAPAPPGD
jgi:ketosteroid isomerase-like protein